MNSHSIIMSPAKQVFEFIAPYNNYLNIILVGDNINPDTRDELMTALQELRKDSPLNLKEPKTIEAKLSDLFRGKLDETLRKKNSICYMDKYVSRDCINILLKDTTYVDELDAMLYHKYLLSVPVIKFMFDLTDVTDENLGKLLATMDVSEDNFNYLVVDDYMGLLTSYIPNKKNIKKVKK